MDTNKISSLTCSECFKVFSSVSAKNRHLKTIHDSRVEILKSPHIICPLCPEGYKDMFENNDNLLKHLTDIHSLNIKQYNLHFKNIQAFATWRANDNREVDYACQRRVYRINGDEDVYYNCNRSDTKGFKSNCTKRLGKVGGSIKIFGVCPSRIIAKFLKNGAVKVKFIETHVGHEDELRSKKLSKCKKGKIFEQLKAVVSDDSTINDSGLSNVQENASESENMLHIQGPMTKIQYQEELLQLQERNKETNTSADFEANRQIKLDALCNFAKGLDEQLFNEFMNGVKLLMNNIERKKGI